MRLLSMCVLQERYARSVGRPAGVQRASRRTRRVVPHAARGRPFLVPPAPARKACELNDCGQDDRQQQQKQLERTVAVIWRSAEEPFDEIDVRPLLRIVL